MLVLSIYLWKRYKDKLFYRWAFLSAISLPIYLWSYISTEHLALSIPALLESKKIVFYLNSAISIGMVAVYIIYLRTKRARDHYQKAHSYYKQGRYDEAEQEALLTVKLSPGVGDAYGILASVNLDRKDCKQGLVYAEKAVAQDPSFAWAHNTLGFAYLCLGERERGIAELRTAAELDSENQTIRENLDAALEGKFRADPPASNQASKK